jgi:hypothetical protein
MFHHLDAKCKNAAKIKQSSHTYNQRIQNYTDSLHPNSSNQVSLFFKPKDFLNIFLKAMQI